VLKLSQLRPVVGTFLFITPRTPRVARTTLGAIRAYLAQRSPRLGQANQRGLRVAHVRMPIGSPQIGELIERRLVKVNVGERPFAFPASAGQRAWGGNISHSA